MNKVLWKILLNYQGEVHEFIRYAKDMNNAMNIGIRALEYKLHRRKGSLSSYFIDRNNIEARQV